MCARADRGRHQIKLLKLISVMLLSGLLTLSFSTTSASSVLEVSQTISCSGMIKNRAVTLFETGFETGDLSEVNVLEAAGGKVDIATTPVHSGMYSARLRTWPTANGGQGRARVHPKPLEPVHNLRRLNMRGYFYVESWDGYVEVLEFSGHPEGIYMLGPWVILREGVISVSHTQGVCDVDVDYPITTGEWYCIELEVKLTADGFVRVYVDGETVIDSGIVDTTPILNGAPIDRAWSGIVICCSSGECFELYVDDLKISMGYIGPEYP